MGWGFGGGGGVQPGAEGLQLAACADCVVTKTVAVARTRANPKWLPLRFVSF